MKVLDEILAKVVSNEAFKKQGLVIETTYISIHFKETLRMVSLYCRDLQGPEYFTIAEYMRRTGVAAKDVFGGTFPRTASACQVVVGSGHLTCAVSHGGLLTVCLSVCR